VPAIGKINEVIRAAKQLLTPKERKQLLDEQLKKHLPRVHTYHKERRKGESRTTAALEAYATGLESLPFATAGKHLWSAKYALEKKDFKEAIGESYKFQFHFAIDWGSTVLMFAGGAGGGAGAATEGLSLTQGGTRILNQAPGALRRIVYREISAVDKVALEAGQPLVPKGSGGTILDHVRGLPTGHISASESVEGTRRFASGNGLVAIDVDVAVAGGTKFITHKEVLEAVAPRVKQIQKVSEALEVLFKGSIPFNAIIR
jgi:hypothetical protein